MTTKVKHLPGKQLLDRRLETPFSLQWGYSYHIHTLKKAIRDLIAIKSASKNTLFPVQLLGHLVSESHHVEWFKVAPILQITKRCP